MAAVITPDPKSFKFDAEVKKVTEELKLSSDQKECLQSATVRSRIIDGPLEDIPKSVREAAKEILELFASIKSVISGSSSSALSTTSTSSALSTTSTLSASSTISTSSSFSDTSSSERLCYAGAKNAIIQERISPKIILDYIKLGFLNKYRETLFKALFMIVWNRLKPEELEFLSRWDIVVLHSNREITIKEIQDLTLPLDFDDAESLRRDTLKPGETEVSFQNLAQLNLREHRALFRALYRSGFSGDEAIAIMSDNVIRPEDPLHFEQIKTTFSEGGLRHVLLDPGLRRKIIPILFPRLVPASSLSNQARSRENSLFLSPGSVAALTTGSAMSLPTPLSASSSVASVGSTSVAPVTFLSAAATSTMKQAGTKPRDRCRWNLCRTKKA